jgi:hypothetical protein
VNIRTADELRDLWASPRAKDKLRKRNRNVELVPSYAENTDALDQYLQENEDDDDDDLDEIEEIDFEQPQRKDLKRKREIHDTIAVREGTPPEWAR